MSFQIRNIREISGDPLAKFATDLSKKLSRFLTKDQLELLEDKEDIYTDGQDFDSVVKVHDELISTKKFEFDTEYYPPTEPDFNKMTLWVRARNTGSNNMTDWSGFNHDIDLFEEPLLIDGTPFDLGIHTDGVKSLAMRFNRDGGEFEDAEYITVTDSSDLFVSGITTGISYFVRFRVQTLAQSEGQNQTLFEKVDDSTPSNGAMLQLTTDGRLVFYVKRAGVEYNNQTATSTIAVDTVYDVWCTYANSGNTVHIWVNNVDKSLTTPGGPTNWHSTLTNHDLSIFRRGKGSNGNVHGDFFDFRVMREKVVSTTEVGRHYTNKWTLANIPFGQVMIANYFATYVDISASFTSASFTSTSFTT